MKNHHTSSALRSGVLAAVSALTLAAATAGAQEFVSPTNVPTVVGDAVEPGDVSSSLAFSLSGSDSLFIEVLAPVPDAVLEIRDAAGNAVVSGNNGFEFQDAQDAGAAANVPGGVYRHEGPGLPDGDYTLVATYPAAPQNTSIVATIFSSSVYEMSLVAPRTNLVAGQLASFGVLVLNNGEPVTGAAPTLTFTPGGGTPVALPLADDGAGPDGAAGDGLYTGETVFDTPGVYKAEGAVSFDAAGATISRRAEKPIVVRAQQATIQGVTTTLETSPAGCVSGLTQTVDISAAGAGDFIVVGGIALDEGFIEDRERVSLAGGFGQATLSFNVDELRTALAGGGPLEFLEPQIFSLGDTIDLEDVGTAPLDEVLSQDDLCREPIIFGQLDRVEPVIVNGFIDALRFVMPVDVEQAGFYQLSYTVAAVSGEEVGVLSFGTSLSAGPNEVSFLLQADDLQALDGPFSIESGLILGPSGSLQESSLGEGGAFERWQFTPVLPGDLNNDGVVSEGSDVPVLARFINDEALVPGDRRDINGDGRINAKDIQEIAGN